MTHTSTAMPAFNIYLLFLVLVIPVTVSCAKRANEIGTEFYRDKVKRMFYHAYEGYLNYAYPYDELKPLSCKGHDTWGSYSLTLIDAMDTLAVMGNYSEFRRIADLVIDMGENAFDMDINVSVFETNIRIVGGLISAHLMMKRAGMQLEEAWPCSGPLLRMADTIARKLLPAFDTPTGMPYGTVNLRHGVPKGETTVTCTAGVGTFVIEFGTLSRLTGDPIFEKIAVRAIRALWKYRSPIGLLGNHIDVKNGKWTALDAGIGGGIDSYFEYLVKGSVLFNLPELIHLFRDFESSIKKYLKKDDWYMWAQMNKGTITLPMFTSLDAFWPSIQMMLGDVDEAMKTLHNFHMVWRQFGFTPEYYNIPKSEAHKGREGYPLRPELIESIMYLYRATKDPALLRMGVDILESIEKQARTDCGYATIKDVRDHRLDDRMESFFLAETTKYLYLLFDTDNFIHNNGSHGQVIDTPSGSCVIEAGGYVFNTEAHPIDLAAVHCCSAKKLEEDKLLEDFHSNLDLLSLLNLVEDEDDMFGTADWKNRRNKKRRKRTSEDEELKKGMDRLKEKKKNSDDQVLLKPDADMNDKVDLVEDKVKKNAFGDTKGADKERKDKDSTETVTTPSVKKVNLGNSNVPGINLEVALPSGPVTPEEEENRKKKLSNYEKLTKSSLSEMQQNIVKVLMDSLNINTDNMSFIDVAAKLESEFKGTKYEKIAQLLVEQLLQEGLEEEERRRTGRISSGRESGGKHFPSGETKKVIAEEVDKDEDEDLEKLLSGLSSIVKETEEENNSGGSENEKVGQVEKNININEEKRTRVEIERGSKETDSRNSLSNFKSTDEFELDDSNPALEKLREHLEMQIREVDDLKNLDSKEAAAASSLKSSFLENKRANFMSLAKTVLKVFTSITTGYGLNLENYDDNDDDDEGTNSKGGPPSLSNLYATLGKQSLRYFEDPSIMHCPAQSFHSRLSVNGEFLVDE